MRCPRCDGRELRITIVLTGCVTCRFDEIEPVAIVGATEFDSSWNPGSPCECAACHWSGRVTDAIVEDRDFDHFGPFQPADLKAIEDELDAEARPGVLAMHARLLIHEVRQLNDQLELARRPGACQPAADVSLDDTVMF